nr:DUF5067 domain-containing protein [uncultured Trichococcus sp.]
MKNVYWVILSVVLVLGACSTGEAEGGSQKSNTNVSVTEVAPSTSETNSVDENDKVYFINGLEYSIPESWTEKISSETQKFYYPEDGALMIDYVKSDGSFTNEESRLQFINGVISGFDSYESESISESEITVAGARAYQYDMNATISGQEYKFTLVLFDYFNGLTSLYMGTLRDSDKDYSKEFENILSSISISDGFLEAQAQAQEEAEAQAIADAQINDETKIVLGRPITIGDYVVTVQSIGKGTDYEGNNILVINYDFTNNSDTEQMASFAVNFTAYQNGIETDSFLMSDDIDLGIGQKKIKPGTTITGVQTGAVLEDDSVLTIELDELISFDEVVFTIEVDPASL